MILAREALKKAIELDPDYEMPYIIMGWTYLHEVSWGWSRSPKDDLNRAYEMAQKALALNSRKADIYGVLSGIKLRQGKLEEAIALREKAVSLVAIFWKYV